MEFAVDAGKVNTREEGWKDLKIGVFQKRPRAQPATPDQWESRTLPEPTARVAWATIAPVLTNMRYTVTVQPLIFMFIAAALTGARSWLRPAAAVETV